MNSTALELKNKLQDPDEDEIYSALIKIGKGPFRELEKDVAPFLDHSNIELRSAAIMVLAFYWKNPLYKERALNMFEQDSEDWVRANALMSWIGFYSESNDKQIINKLYKILINDNEDSAVRAQAYLGILLVSGLPKTEWPKLVENIEEDVDWSLVNRIVQR